MGHHEPTRYTVYPDGYPNFVNSDKGAWTISVEKTNDGDVWAVRRHSQCLIFDGGWEYEPLPSSRTDKWLKLHRFPLADALKRAEALVDHIKVNGYTAAEASEEIRLQIANGEAE